MDQERPRTAEKSRTLIVHKDDGGYGLTLSGDKPTRVQTVRPGGASHRAGVREGDVIIKVNGQQVTESNHGDVVKLIQTGSYVALTVVHSSRFTGLAGGQEGGQAEITGPSPPNNDAERRLHSDKVHTLQLMVEQQSRVVEELRSSLARSNSKKVRAKLEAALAALSELESQQQAGPATPVAPPRSDSLGGAAPPPLPDRNPRAAVEMTAPVPPPRPPATSPGLPPPPPRLAPRPGLAASQESLVPSGPGRRGSTAAPPSPANPSPNHGRTRSSPVPVSPPSPRYETPPGTPPPPYPELVTWSALSPHQPSIITMEDDSDCEEEAGACFNSTMAGSAGEGDHGPFNSLPELLQHPAHLAVFLNYVISNSDPHPLLFYLITDAYKTGSAKEMRRWAYEIHSCFLVPGSPLQLPNIDPVNRDSDRNIIEHIDRFLAEETAEVREEILVRLFWKVRSRARDTLKVQLDDFRAKRAAGLGNIFGPADTELRLCDESPDRRAAVITDCLIPVLETMAEDLECATDRNSTLCSSLATVLNKSFATKCPKALSIIEKIPTFVSKENNKKKFLGKLLKKSLQVNGHNFVLKHYDQVTLCNQSHGIIWGIGPQGYQCANCGFDVLKKFVHKVEEACVGAIKHPKPGKTIGIIDRIRSNNQLHLADPTGRKPSVSPSPSMNRGPATDLSPSFTKYTPDEGSTDAVDTASGGGRAGQDSGRTSLEPECVRVGLVAAGLVEPSIPPGAASPRMALVTRSESAKEQGTGARTRSRGGVRKHSDPALGRRHRLSLTDGEGGGSKSGSSSSSSIAELRCSQSWEAAPLSLPPSSLAGGQAGSDSDLESDQADQPEWRNSLTADQLAGLDTRETKRQDVINELFHTERSHVRNLRVLDRVFRRPLLDSGLMPREVVDRLFPNLGEVLGVHSSYNTAMRTMARAGFPIGNIGELLSDMFLGSYGDKLIEVGAEFTKNQKFTIEELKRIRSRDSRVEQKLSELEADPACRRLQLQSLLPVEHTRLVKYPLLLEQIVKYSRQSSAELERVKEVTSRTKEILDSIDKQVAEAQNRQKLVEVQRSLDTSGLEKMGPDNPVCVEYRSVDLTRFRLLYEGQLTLNLGGENKRTKNIELHVLLLEDCVMFLQRQDDRYLLKFHTGASSIVPGGTRDEVKKIHSPIIKFSTMLVRPVATNKRAFYLMNTGGSVQVGAQLYELQAGSTTERATWLTHISEASAAYKAKEQRFRPSNSHGNISFVQGRQQMFEQDSERRGSGPGHTGRSQSFNEQSLRQRELAASSVQSRPLPSPPVEREQLETLERKIEKLSRKDEEVARALEEKQKIIADIFSIPPEDYDSITDLVASQQERKDAKDVLLAVMSQADTLARCVNDCLKVADEEGDGGVGDVSSEERGLAARLTSERGVRLATPPSDKLVTITTSMNTNLTALLAIVQDQEEEKQKLRKELQASQEQVRAMIVTGAGSDSFRSRPDSFVSLESEVSEEGGAGGEGDTNPGSPGARCDLLSPMKDSTPTNEEADPVSEEERREIVESSDC